MVNDYWKKRIEAEQLAKMERDATLSDEMTRLYNYHFKELEKEIRAFSERYASKNNLPLSEVKARVDGMDVKAFEEKAKRYVAEKDFSAKANSELSLYNLKMKMNRLELLQYQLDLEMVALGDAEHKMTERFLNDEYIQTLKTQSGLLGRSVLSSSQIEKVVQTTLNTSFKGAKWSNRIWQRQDALRGIVAQMTEDYLLKGRNPTTMISKIRKEFGVSASEAKRLAVTEGARVATEAERQSYIANGYDEYEFIAEPKACDICRPLDGKIFKVADMLPGENAAPMHPHCRCSTAAHFSMSDGEYEKLIKESSESRNMVVEREMVEPKIYEDLHGEKIDNFFNQQKSYRKWYNGLNEEQRKVINYYTREEGYTRINGILRNGKKNYEQEAYRLAYDRDKPYIKETIKEASQAMDVLKTIKDFVPEKSFKTYRGISFWDREDIYSKLQVGENTILDRGFMSTSLDKTIIDDFADGGKEYRFEITVPKGYNKGKYIGELSDVPHEKEFLFDPESKFKIVDIKTEGSVTNVIAEAIYD